MTSEESDLRSALLLEQSAVNFLRNRPAARRRAAFHLVLAGHRFNKAQLADHALRCYLSARQQYLGRTWDLAEDHINFTIGKLACDLGMCNMALDAYSLLLNDNQQAAAQQAVYLKEYITVWSQVRAGRPELDLQFPLPHIDNDSLEILLRSDVTQAIKTESSVWAQLDQEVLMARRFGRARGMSQTAFTRQASSKPLCVVGEPFFFECTLVNPLHVDLELRNLTLLIDLQEDAGAAGDDGAAAAPPAAQAPGVDVLAIPTLDIGAQGSIRIQFRVIARRPGQLHLRAIEFQLNNMTGHRRFLERGRRLNQSRADKMGVNYGPDFRLLPMAIPPMPLLAAKFVMTDEPVFVGQVVRGTLELKNVGSSRLIELAVALSHADLLVLGSAGAEAALPTYTWADFDALAEAKPKLAVSALEPGEAISLPVWVMGKAPGNVEVRCVFAYASETPHRKMPYRLLRVALPLQFVPGVTVTATMRRAPHHVGMAYLQLTAENLNLRESAAFRFKQVVCCSPAWQLAGLCEGQGNKPDLLVLPPKVSTTLHFVLRRAPPDAATPDSRVALADSPDAARPDTTCSMPYFEFFGRNTRTRGSLVCCCC